MPNTMLANPLHSSEVVGHPLSKAGNSEFEISNKNESKQVKDLKFLLEDRESLLKDRDFDINRLKTKVERQNRSFGHAKTEMCTMVDMLLMASKRIDALEAEKPKFEQATKTLTADNEAKAAEIKQLMEKLALAESRLEKSEEEANQKGKELADVKDKFTKVKAELEKLNQGSGFLGLF